MRWLGWASVIMSALVLVTWPLKQMGWFWDTRNTDFPWPAITILILGYLVISGNSKSRP